MTNRTTEEIQTLGTTALLDALGPVDTLRYLRESSMGKGDSLEEKYRRDAAMQPGEVRRLIEKHRRGKADSASAEPLDASN